MPELSKNEDDLIGCFLLLLFFISAILLIGGFWFLLNRYHYKNECVRLTNGYMIGHPAIFHQNDFHFEMVLRGPNGQVITRTDYMIKFMRHPISPNLVILDYPSPHGRKQITMPGEGMMDLVFPEKQRGRKWNEEKKGFPNDLGIVSTDLATVLFALKDDKRFGKADCGTPWFDF